jgi:hypothetical protein
MRYLISIGSFTLVFAALYGIAHRQRARANRGLPPGRLARAVGSIVGRFAGFPSAPRSAKRRDKGDPNRKR